VEKNVVILIIGKIERFAETIVGKKFPEGNGALKRKYHGVNMQKNMDMENG